MDKKTFKKLKKGKKIYLVTYEDYCECPHCDGSCNEPQMVDAKVFDIDLKEERIFYKFMEESTYIFNTTDLDSVFTNQREATRKLKELFRDNGIPWYG